MGEVVQTQGGRGDGPEEGRSAGDAQSAAEDVIMPSIFFFRYELGVNGKPYGWFKSVKAAYESAPIGAAYSIYHNGDSEANVA